MTSLNNRGYGIRKTDENKDLIEKIKKELLISPKNFSSIFSSTKEYPIYLEICMEASHTNETEVSRPNKSVTKLCHYHYYHHHRHQTSGPTWNGENCPSCM